MNNGYSDYFILFAKKRMASQADDIRRWQRMSNNPVLRECCRWIIEAAGGGDAKEEGEA